MIAFATILAVVAGLTISASTSFAHYFWTNVIHKGAERKPGEEVRFGRISAFVVGAIAITIAMLLGPTANVAFLVALAFAVAAPANLPVIAFSIFWRRFNTNGAVVGLAVGLIASIGLILVSPSLMAVDPPNAFRLDFLAQFSAHFSVTNLPPATNSTNFRYAPTRDSAPKKPPATDLGYFTIGRAAYNRRELFGSERYRLAAFSHQRKITFVRTRLVCA